MLRFLFQRFGRGLIALFIFLTMMFFVAQILIPHDWTVQFAMSMTAEQRAELQEELGLDMPLWQQYLGWISHVARGDLGIGFSGFPISDQLKALLPQTLLVFLTGTVLAFMIGGWLGRVTAWRGSDLLSGLSSFSGIALYTSFPPWLSFLMVYFFARKLDLFPDVIQRTALLDFGRFMFGNIELEASDLMLIMLATMIGGFIITWGISALVTRIWQVRLPLLLLTLLGTAMIVGSWYGLGVGARAIEVMHFAGLPIITFVLLTTGETMLIMQTTMRDTINQEYIRTARAKGLRESMIRDKHAGRNAIIPVLTRLVVSLPYLLTGIVIIERSLQWEGIGETLFVALYNQDMPFVMGTLIVIGVISMLARVILEVLALQLDPRTRARASSTHYSSEKAG